MKFSTRVTVTALTLMLLFTVFSITAAAEGCITYGIGFVNASGLNLRQQPSTDSPILATANSGECVVVLSQDNGWCRVSYNLQEGYMLSSYLSVSTVENAELGYGIVNGSGVNLRSGPSTSHTKIGTVSNGDRLYIIGLNNGWYKVLTGSGSCYIRSDYLSLSEIPYENHASSNSPQYFRQGKAIAPVPGSAAASQTAPVQTVSDATGAQILSKATEYLGTPYVYGGASPSGFDCSGFVYYVYGTFGISVGRTPAEQYNAGTVVDKASLQPGDIVLFAGTAGSGISHAGIYAGNGQFIHSPNSRSTVSYSDLTSGYWSEHFYCGIRVV